MLDRFIWYSFDAADSDVAHLHAAALVADRDALRDRVVERLKETAELPEQVRRAYQSAETKL